MKIGQPVTVFGVRCVITKVLPCGTIEVESLDGQRAYRVSGLAWTDPSALDQLGIQRDGQSEK